MLHLILPDGNVEHYLTYESINKHSIALYNTENINENSYIVSTDNIVEKLKTGDKTTTLPAIYDSNLHGPLTNKSFSKYRISINIIATSDNVDDIKSIAKNIKNSNITIKSKE